MQKQFRWAVVAAVILAVGAAFVSGASEGGSGSTVIETSWLNSPVLQTFLWVLFLAGVLFVVVRWFGDAIKQLLARVESADLKGYSFNFAKKAATASAPASTTDASSKREEDPQRNRLYRTPDQSMKEGKIITDDAHEFWLGHDLMWTEDWALRGGPSAKIMHGLKQAAHHARRLGLDEQANYLDSLHLEFQNAPRDMTPTERGRFVENLEILKGECATEVVGRLMKAQER